MNVTNRIFVVVVTICALLLLLSDAALMMWRLSNHIPDSGLSIIDPGERLSDGATYAGLGIACAVLVAHLLTQPGWWRWVVALGVATLAVEVPNEFLSFIYLRYFIQNPDLSTLPLPLLAIWMPGILLALLAWLGRRDRTAPTFSPPDGPAPTSTADQEPRSRDAIGTGAVTAVTGAAVVLLLVLAVAVSLGGVQLMFGVESEWIPLGNLSYVAGITAVVAGWQTGPSRANAAWLVAAVLLSSMTIIFHVGPDALPYPVLVLAALVLACSHRRLAARALRLVEV